MGNAQPPAKPGALIGTTITFDILTLACDSPLASFGVRQLGFRSEVSYISAGFINPAKCGPISTRLS